MKYSAKWPQYAAQWDGMVIKPSRIPEFEGIAKNILANKARYQAIEAATGVKWFHIGVLHTRESNANFNTYLGNGQTLAKETTIVPKGRGPFTGPNAFLNGAIDALKIDGLTSVSDWRLEKILYYCEQFNGWGYDPKPSPYLWGGTNVQIIGKYVADHVFDSKVWDMQPGCAPILSTLSKMDPTVKFVRETTATDTPSPIPQTPHVQPPPTARGIVYISYGLGGEAIEVWSTGLRQLVARCKAAGFDTRNSPYQWNAYNTIIDDINSRTAADAPIAVGGASLGDDYAPTIGSRSKRKIAYLFGFQDSTWAPTLQITPNVLVADSIYNPSWWQTLGLGSGQWKLVSGNTITKLRNIPIYAAHPDDWGVAQDIVFSQIHKLLAVSA